MISSGEERVFVGMAEQKNRPRKQSNARGMVAAGVAGTILPSGLAIPHWVAPLQSPTPFRQAAYSVARKTHFGEELPSAREVQNRHKRLPGQEIENRHEAPTGSAQNTTAIFARQIGILGIIVIHTRPPSTHCRF